MKKLLVVASLFVCLIVAQSLFSNNVVSKDYEDDVKNEVMEQQAHSARKIDLLLEELEVLLGEKYDLYFAGSWLGGDDYLDPYVGLTIITPEIEAMAKNRGVNLVKHKYSYKELHDLALDYFISNFIEGSADNFIQASGVDEILNKVELTVYRFDDLKKENPELYKKITTDDRVFIIFADEN